MKSLRSTYYDTTSIEVIQIYFGGIFPPINIVLASFSFFAGEENGSTAL